MHFNDDNSNAFGGMSTGGDDYNARSFAQPQNQDFEFENSNANNAMKRGEKQFNLT